MGEKRVIEQVASNVVHNDDWFLKDSPTQDTSKISATNLKAILGADGTLALEEIANAIAEEYDSTHTYYNTGLVFHEGVLYQCTATSVTGTWDSTKWNAVDIKDLLDNVSTNIGYLWNTISNTIAGNYDTSSTYNTGDYAIYSLKLYRCKDDDVTGAWNSSKWEEVNIPEYIDYVLVNAGKVDDVKVDGTSVVTNKVAEIEIPVKDVEVDGTSVVNASGVAEITLPDVPVQDVQIKTDSTYDSVVDVSGNAKIDLSSMTAYGEVPNLPQAIATFNDGSDNLLKSLTVSIEPVQDLHGYDSPWAGGAGKNKFDYSQLTNASGWTNTSGTYSGNIYNLYAYAGSVFPTQPTYKVNTAYTLSMKVVDTDGTSRFVIEYTDSTSDYVVISSTNIGNYVTVTSNPSKTISKIYFTYNNSGNLSIREIMLEEGTSRTSWTPYSNICPISGWTEANVTRTGKNLWGGEKLADDIVAKVPNAMKDTTNKTVSYSAGFVSGKVLFDNFKPNTVYTIFMMTSSSANNVMVRYTDGTTDYINKYSFTVTQTNKSIECIIGTWSTGTTVLKYDECGIFEGVLTAKDFVPYNGQTYKVEFKDGDNPLTVYGGTLDVVSGVLTVDRVKMTIDGVNETITNSWGTTDNGYAVYKTMPVDRPISSDTLCDKFSYSDKAYMLMPVNTYVGGSGSAVNWTFILPKTVTSKDEADTWFSNNPTTVTYPLATPQTYQLTPTQVKSLLGTNNVWADTGDINDCVYRRDMSSTIDDIIARLEALEG